jgi:hypothetical protein
MADQTSDGSHEAAIDDGERVEELIEEAATGEFALAQRAFAA